MEFVVQVLGVRNGMKFVVQEFLSIRVKVELVIQRFIVGGIGAMAVLHLVPWWNTLGPAAGLLLGPGPHTSGPGPDTHLGQGISRHILNLNLSHFTAGLF